METLPSDLQMILVEYIPHKFKVCCGKWAWDCNCIRWFSIAPDPFGDFYHLYLTSNDNSIGWVWYFLHCSQCGKSVELIPIDSIINFSPRFCNMCVQNYKLT